MRTSRFTVQCAPTGAALHATLTTKTDWRITGAELDRPVSRVCL